MPIPALFQGISPQHAPETDPRSHDEVMARRVEGHHPLGDLTATCSIIQALFDASLPTDAVVSLVEVQSALMREIVNTASRNVEDLRAKLQLASEMIGRTEEEIDEALLFDHLVVDREQLRERLSGEAVARNKIAA
jgi:hypothetical protein